MPNGASLRRCTCSRRVIWTGLGWGVNMVANFKVVGLTSDDIASVDLDPNVRMKIIVTYV